ncbi:MAG: hypothetical protein PW786_10205, partial [Arachidicoccus sp.]|nr:hypothetical protein [Arachidicoccus sp.]
VLSHNLLSISNTGKPIDITPKEIFLRFKKGNQCSDGTGLGLAIVKQICDKSDFKIVYEYMNDKHTFKVFFDQNNTQHSLIRENAVQEISA